MMQNRKSERSKKPTLQYSGWYGLRMVQASRDKIRKEGHNVSRTREMNDGETRQNHELFSTIDY